MVISKIKAACIAAAVFAVTAVLAFDAPRPAEQSAQDLEWFQYLGNINGGGESNPENYELVDEPGGCDNGQFLCAIEAEEDSSNPGLPTQAGVDDPETIENRSTPPMP